MNKCYLVGEIIEIFDYKFLYNSKIHNSKIIFKIHTLQGDSKKREIIRVNAYDEIADYFYRYFKEKDLISIEGTIRSGGEIEIHRIYMH